MFRMAIRARRRISFPQRDCFAVNTRLHVTRFFRMTCAARLGLAGKVQWRSWRTGKRHVVRIMAIPACRRIRLPRLQCQTVDTGAITVCLSWVTRRTIHGLENLVVVWMGRGNIRMTTNARIGGVGRCGQLRLIHKEGNGFPGGIGFEKSIVGMTVQAVTVFQTRHECERSEEKTRQ